MASTIENLAKMTKHLSMDPVYDTNWCDMPAELKLVCIGKMGFRERLSLRRTAKAEKSLVDSQKMEFHSGDFSRGGFQLNLFSNMRDWKRDCVINGRRKPNEAVEMMNHVIKIIDFEWISFYYPKKQMMNFTEEISAKYICFEACESKTVVDALRKLKKGVESIMIDATERKDGWMKPAVGHYDLDEILAISQIQNVPSWHIKDCSQEDCLHKVAQMWINKNSKIGSTFQVSSYCNFRSESRFDFLEPFLEYFTDRIVSETEKTVRIRTNNPDRHILLECGLDEVIKIDDEQKYFRLLVISAEMKESEYDDNCKEWILSIDGEAYG
ncbi:unnamed protein product [Caenorhabditis nigoni]